MEMKLDDCECCFFSGRDFFPCKAHRVQLRDLLWLGIFQFGSRCRCWHGLVGCCVFRTSREKEIVLRSVGGCRKFEDGDAASRASWSYENSPLFKMLSFVASFLVKTAFLENPLCMTYKTQRHVFFPLYKKAASSSVHILQL